MSLEQLGLGLSIFGIGAQTQQARENARFNQENLANQAIKGQIRKDINAEQINEEERNVLARQNVMAGKSGVTSAGSPALVALDTVEKFESARFNNELVGDELSTAKFLQSQIEGTKVRSATVAGLSQFGSVLTEFARRKV